MIDFAEIYERIGYVFKDSSLLEKALTHSSFDRENNYERLEFLGDSIVGYAVSDLLYHQEMKTEGEMTDLRKRRVCEEPLSQLADDLGFSKNCQRRNCSLSEKMRSDLYEAVTAAIYLDSGIEDAIAFVKRTILLVPPAAPDYKTQLQQYCDKKKIDFKIVHTEEGKDNKKRFTAEVYIDGNSKGTGKGKKKKAAENEACRLALKALHLI